MFIYNWYLLRNQMEFYRDTLNVPLGAVMTSGPGRRNKTGRDEEKDVRYEYFKISSLRDLTVNY